MRDHVGSFDCLRLIAATGVLVGHGFVLSGNADQRFLGASPEIASEFSVYAFFAMSGYLVTQSWFRDPNVLRFMGRRARRIFPGLAFVVAGSALFIGPLVTTLSLSEYFSRFETWSYFAKVVVFPPQHGLPEAFVDNPFPKIVNGSLWTLRVEFALYALVALLGVAAVLRGRGAPFAAAAICLVVSAVFCWTPWLRDMPFAHQTMFLFFNATPFFVGAALSRFELNGKASVAIVAAIALTGLLCGELNYLPFALVALPIAVIAIGRSLSCSLDRFGDYSYGLYLWGFPVQQCVAHFFPSIGPTWLFVAGAAVSFPLAAISWRFVEEPAMKKPDARGIGSPPPAIGEAVIAK